jgi:hypothetical protein
VESGCTAGLPKFFGAARQSIQRVAVLDHSGKVARFISSDGGSDTIDGPVNEIFFTRLLKPGQLSWQFSLGAVVHGEERCQFLQMMDYLGSRCKAFGGCCSMADEWFGILVAGRGGGMRWLRSLVQRWCRDLSPAEFKLAAYFYRWAAEVRDGFVRRPRVEIESATGIRIRDIRQADFNMSV